MPNAQATGRAAARAEPSYFCGYASVFGRLDKGRDIVLKGAFLRSIQERGLNGIRVLWQHDPHEPIGVLEDIHEDDFGLFVRARLLTDVRRASEARALLHASALDGLSIGYKTIVADRDERTGIRHLKDVDLWEVSLVTFPMQEAARVMRFKTAANPDWRAVAKTIAGFERGMNELAAVARRRSKPIPFHGH